MSSVNKTENYGLSQFSTNDQPTWMGDYSGDMQKIDTALGNSVKRTSDKFSESVAYAAGAYCIKDDLLYKFKSAKSVGAWDASKVQATTVMSEITGLTDKCNGISIVNTSCTVSSKKLTISIPFGGRFGLLVLNGYDDGSKRFSAVIIACYNGKLISWTNANMYTNSDCIVSGNVNSSITVEISADQIVGDETFHISACLYR